MRKTNFSLMEARDVRVIIHFLWKKGQSNKEIEAEINDVYGEGTVSLRTVQKWTQRYGEGNESFEDQPRSGRPQKDELVKVVQQLLEDEPHLSQKKIAKRLEVHHSTIHQILTKVMGLKRVNFRWIPYCLSDDQKAVRVELSKAILETLGNASTTQLGMVITGDETWVYFSNPRASMWIDSEAPRPKRPKLSIGAKK